MLSLMCSTSSDRMSIPNIRTLSVPRYQDQPHLIVEQWTREFLRRFCGGFPNQPERMLVEVGDPGEAIVRVARELRSDLILIAWSGSLDQNRARTANAVLGNAPCPVMFLRTRPERPARKRGGPGASVVASRSSLLNPYSTTQRPPA